MFYKRGKDQTKLKNLVQSIHLSAKEHGLDWPIFRPLLLKHFENIGEKFSIETDDKDVMLAIEQVIRDGEIPEKPFLLKRLAGPLEYILDIEIDQSVLNSRLEKNVGWFRLGFSVVLFVFVCYMVFGGILTRQAAFEPMNSATVTLILLVSLVFFLGCLEGLQISVTTLRLKDLQSFRESYPMAFSLHRKFRSTVGTNRFLAGRQFFVIFIAFTAAQLTSFPEMKAWPFTSIPFPLWMMPWFSNIFLRLGLLGALFVLWFGQLAPQFWANKYPHGFLNNRLMKIILHMSFAIDSLGFTTPGNWLSNWGPTSDAIPVSARERYLQEVDTSQGYGSLGISKIWVLDKAEAKLQYTNKFLFMRDGFDFVTDGNLLLKAASPKPVFKYTLTDRKSPLMQMDFFAHPVIDQRLEDGWKGFSQRVEPRWGPFHSGNILEVATTIEASDVEEDSIVVSIPTKFVFFKVTFVDQPTRIKSVIMESFLMDNSRPESIPVSRQDLDIVIDEEGNPTVEFCEFFPQQNKFYNFIWDVRHDH